MLLLLDDHNKRYQYHLLVFFSAQAAKGEAWAARLCAALALRG
jgi:hypothetical protein